MNKKYENQLLRIIEKGVKERVFKVDDTFTAEQKVLKNNYENGCRWLGRELKHSFQG